MGKWGEEMRILRKWVAKAYQGGETSRTESDADRDAANLVGACPYPLWPGPTILIKTLVLLFDFYFVVIFQLHSLDNQILLNPEVAFARDETVDPSETYLPEDYMLLGHRIPQSNHQVQKP
ncbi:hypothetical protein QQP08_014323 [Theobroma cacao]|nr:hypothetical protein QQP08_014323 [Theobroma cacao]